MAFNNLIDVIAYFSSKERCIDFLLKERWQGQPKCVFCDSGRVRRLKCNYGYHRCKDCKRMFSATKGTIFEKSQIPLQKWFLAIYFITIHKKGISSIQLSKDIGVTQKTAWFMAHRIRFALKNKELKQMFGVVQLDETFIGGRNKNRFGIKKIANSQGRSLKTKIAVVGILQPGGGLYLRVVKNTKGETLKPIIYEMVEKGSLVISDEWKGYKGLSNDYMHATVNHRQQEFVRGGIHTNTIENFWSVLKRGLYGIYHKVSWKHLDFYCDEFCFRYVTKSAVTNDRFNYTFQKINCRITYDELKNKDSLKDGMIEV